jgi:WD40 repeat protein
MILIQNSNGKISSGYNHEQEALASILASPIQQQSSSAVCKIDEQKKRNITMKLATLITLFLCLSTSLPSWAQSGISADNAIELTPLTVLSGHTGWVHDIAWNSDGSKLASAGADSTVRVWDASNGATLQLLTGHSGEVVSVGWGPGDEVASGSLDNTVWVWNGSSGEGITTLNGHTGDVWSVGWASDGSWLASAGDDLTVWLWQPDGSGEPILENSPAPIYSLAVNGNQIAVGAYDGTITLLQANSDAAPESFNAGLPINALAFGPDSLSAVGESSQVVLWQNGEPIQISSGQPALYSVDISPGGDLLAVGGPGGSIELYSLPDGALIGTLTGHSGLVSALTFSPDGSRLASASYDGTAIIWGLR